MLVSAMDCKAMFKVPPISLAGNYETAQNVVKKFYNQAKPNTAISGQFGELFSHCIISWDRWDMQQEYLTLYLLGFMDAYGSKWIGWAPWRDVSNGQMIAFIHLFILILIVLFLTRHSGQPLLYLAYHEILL